MIDDYVKSVMWTQKCYTKLCHDKSRGVITMRRAHKWAQNVLNLRLKVISFAIMTPSEQFYVS